MRALNERANADGSLPARRAEPLELHWRPKPKASTALNTAPGRHCLLDPRAAGTPLNGGAVDSRFETLAGQVTATDSNSRTAGRHRCRCWSRSRSEPGNCPPERQAAGRHVFSASAASGAPVERRTFSTTTPVGGPGANRIQTERFRQALFRLSLRERVVVRQLGATVLGGLVGDLSIPRLKASATAQWIAEGVSISAADPQTDQGLALTPKHVGGIR